MGIKWGGSLISLAIHPWSVAQDYPRVLPRLIQHYEYFLLVVGVTPAAEREERVERDREKRERKTERQRKRWKVRFAVRAG